MADTSFVDIMQGRRQRYGEAKCSSEIEANAEISHRPSRLDELRLECASLRVVSPADLGDHARMV